MKKILFYLGIILLFHGSYVIGQTIHSGSWDALSFPILAWCGPSSELASDSIFKDMADAGFTADLSFSLVNPESAPTPAQNLRMLDLAGRFSLKLLVYDSRMTKITMVDSVALKRLDGVIADYKNHPALLGYYLKDEPGTDSFERLAKIKDYLVKNDPIHLAYINLFPNYADKRAQLKASSYDVYVSEFLASVRPQILSYDHYGIVQGKLRPEYFENLEIVRHQALASGTPFWAFTLSMPHYSYNMPSEGEISFQLYCDLAYGAKGLQYFTYGIAPELSMFAIIGSNGAKTSIWAMARNVNAGILNLAPVLRTLTSVDVYHSAPLPAGTRGIPEDFYVTSAEDGPILIGYFQNRNGIPYVLIVNRDYNRESNPMLYFSASVAGIKEISKQSGAMMQSIVPDANHSLHLRFKPGEGRLFMISLQ